jgi:aerobic-type carbon monoxide dehydrogenase small subunit (CoxS/CutS family)
VSDRVRFYLNGEAVDWDPEPGESLLTVLREGLGATSVKDGCSPQGQCGCCTVLVDGDARVACVTPVTRVDGRHVTTVEGLDPDVREALVGSFVATAGSQCGFCTPGILVRAAALQAKGKTRPVDVDRALAAHLCRCTGWQSIVEALTGSGPPSGPRDLTAASRRAALEGGVGQRVAPDVPLGHGGFADDRVPAGALVAVPLAPGAGQEPPGVETVRAGGVDWIVAGSLADARVAARKVQGRRTTAAHASPLPSPAAPDGGVALATSWVEPAYLEPDASWCEPGGVASSPLANGGAFGGKEDSVVTVAARQLADHFGRTVRVLLAREDVVRLGPKRPPIAATARADGAVVRVDGVVAGDVAPFTAPIEWPYAVVEEPRWTRAEIVGPATSSALRAVGLAERAVLLEGALDAASADRSALVTDARAAAVLLESCVRAASGALAGATVELDAAGAITGVRVRVAAGDPLDAVVLRSYVLGAVHMALGWVLTEALTVDPVTGDVHDLTIRSFGVIRAGSTPPIAVEIVDDVGPPLAGASDAVFAATAAATWNAVTRAEGARPATFPATGTRTAARLRR